MDWPILSGLGEDERRQVLQAARRRTFARHEVVYHRADPADTLHLVVKGRFAVKVVTPLGDTATLSIVRPGELFGELALLEDAPDERNGPAITVALQRGATTGEARRA